MALHHSFGPVLDEAALKGATDMVVFCITTRNLIESEGIPAQIAQASASWVQLRRLYAKTPGARFLFMVDGYDDDPRELWEVPEVVQVLRGWAAKTDPLMEARILPTHRSFLVAMGCDPDIRPETRQPSKGAGHA